MTNISRTMHMPVISPDLLLSYLKLSKKQHKRLFVAAIPYIAGIFLGGQRGQFAPLKMTLPPELSSIINNDSKFQLKLKSVKGLPPLYI